MKVLKSLTRLSRHNLNEHQRLVNIVMREQQDCAKRNEAHAQQLQKEIQFVHDHPETAADFQRYFQRHQQIQTQLFNELQSLTKNLELLRDQLLDYFSDHKKNELLMANKIQTLKNLRDKKENDAADEAAIMNHHRRKED